AKKKLGSAAIAAIGGGVEDSSRHRSSAAAAIRPCFVAPGKRGSKEIPDYSSMAEGSTALASARISTRDALARFYTLAQASAVAPVVITSTTTTMRFARNMPLAAVTRNAPATLLQRCAAVSSTWLGVGLILASMKQSTGTSVSLPTSWASMADWLK